MRVQFTMEKLQLIIYMEVSLALRSPSLALPTSVEVLRQLHGKQAHSIFLIPVIQPFPLEDFLADTAPQQHTRPFLCIC